MKLTAPTARRFWLTFLVLLGVICALWLWGRSTRVSNPKDINSVSITMERTSCFGTCPVYSVAIHGNGVVNYSGQQFVRVIGSQTGVTSRGQLLGLLQDFDRIHFFARFEYRMANCTDVPDVIISISVDGKRKRVWRAECVGGAGWKQADDEVFRLAQEIDDIAGTARWIR